MLAPLNAVECLLARLAENRDAIPWQKPGGIASLILELPDGVTDLAGMPEGSGYLLHAPSRHEIRIGAGSAARWQFAGPQRLGRLRARAQRLQREWLRLDPDETGVQPAALLAFAHDAADPMQERWQGLPNTLLWLPSVAIHAHPAGAAAIFHVALPADPEKTLSEWHRRLERLLGAGPGAPRAVSRLHRTGSLPGLASWREAVRAALTAIADGRMEKVVLARRLRIRGQRPFDARQLPPALAYLYPDCQTIQIRLGGRLFAAATPERLVCLRGGQLHLDALAGTCPRAARPADDEALGQALMRSPKQRREHQLVVRAIREGLAPLTPDLEIPHAPRLLRLGNVQHLWTPIRGRVTAPTDLPTLAAALHPTPATGGYPAAPAQAWREAREPFSRGWYTGAAGWLTPDLEGELWVLLRCALLEGDRAELYAGAGVIADSDADEEWRETESKLEGMLAALRYA